MKILVAYFSQTGNTEQIAKAILEEISGSNDADLSKIEGVDASSLDGYDLIFVGTAIHAGGLAAPAKDFLAALPNEPKYSLAGFVTHASDVYSKENYEKAIAGIGDICSEKKINYLGCFDCRGRLAPAIQPMVQKARKMSDDEWAKLMEDTDKHPNADDELKAKEFAKEVLSKI